MSYQATVLEIMIASPGDVPDERRITREVIHGWNAADSVTKKVVLMPIGWETHSVPEVGDRPQAIVNKQLLENCDLLIGIFWTRIGTPTGESVSGTAEEIETHIKRGKPAMLYFSSRPVAPGIINREQYDQLKDFEQRCRKIALVEAFDSPEVFRDKLTRQLAKTVNEDKYIASLIPHSAGNPSNQQSGPSQPSMTLSKEAKELLLAAAQDPDGSIRKHASSSSTRGVFLLTNKQQFGVRNEPRIAATWQDALQELIDTGFLQPRGNAGVVFDVTRRGYEFADEIATSEPHSPEKPYPMVLPVFKKI